MRARQRHLTGRAAGAQFYFDSRRISGLSNGDAVSQWDDLSSASNNATQGTAANQPAYRTNIKGGQPMVDFDGSNDRLVTGTTTYGSGATLIATAKSDTTGNNGVIVYIGNLTSYTPNYNTFGLNHYQNKWVVENYSNPTDRSVTYSPDDTDFNVLSGIINDNSVNRIFKNGIAGGTATSVSININSAVLPSIGMTSATLNPLNGYIGVLSYFNVAFTASLRKRFEHAQAYSFKIACS
jgi:hypothetical protein